MILKEKTCERIAAENGVARNTVIRAEQFANGVDAAEEAVPGIKQEILTGSIKPTEKAVAAIAKARRRKDPLWSSSSGRPKNPKSPRKSTKTKKSPKRSPRKSRNVSAALQKPCKPSGKCQKRCSSPLER